MLFGCMLSGLIKIDAGGELQHDREQNMTEKSQTDGKRGGAGAGLCWEPRAPYHVCSQKRDVFLREHGSSYERSFFVWFLMDICASSKAFKSPLCTAHS